MEVGQRSVEEARTIGHAVTLCHALAQGACSVALLSGDLAATERFVALLLEHSATQALPIWQARGRCFEAALLISRGDLDRGLPQLHEALEGLGEARFAAMFGGMLAEGLGQAGQVGPALRTVETAIAHSERDEELWCLPELLRIKAELLVAANQSDAPAAAERLFRTALDTARDQGALSWQLRTAISLARQQRGRAGAEKARDIVAELCRQFSEGWGTRDLQAAKQLLERSRT
jgi:predicted ATPase